MAVVLLTISLKVKVVKGVVVEVHLVRVRVVAVVQIRTGFRMPKPHRGLMVAGTNVVLMRVNIRVAAVVVVRIITVMVVKVVLVWLL